MKYLWTLAALLLSPSVFAAAPKGVGVYAVQLQVSGETRKGYLVFPMSEGFDAAKGGALEILQRFKKLSLLSDLDYSPSLPLIGRLAFSTKAPLMLNPLDIKGVAKAKLPHDGDEVNPFPSIVTAKQAQFLKKTPVAVCKSATSDGEYWLSYAPAVNDAKLKAFCETPASDPVWKDDQSPLKQLGKNGDVFSIRREE